MKWIPTITFIFITIAACLTVIFVKLLKPTTDAAFLFFTIWLVLPYIIMSIILILFTNKKSAPIHWYIVALVTSILGIFYTSDLIFWNPDAQEAIALLMTPILQFITAAILLPITSWIVKTEQI